MRSLSLLFVILAGTPGLAQENWTQFRGPNGTGLSQSADLPTTWSEEEHIVWKTPLPGKGWSSPVLWGNQVWVTTAQPDGTEFFTLCLDRETGKVVHHLTLFSVAKPAFCHAFNSYASPTPVIEKGRIYVHFGTYGTVCLDTQTGKPIWSRRDLHCDHHRGPGSSPILVGNLLILHFDGFDVQYVAALDKDTGKTVWKKERSFDYGTTNGDLKKAYATPSLIEVGGQAQLISPAAMATTAYDPQTGKELWVVRHGGMNVASPPLFGQGQVYLCTGDGGDKLLAVRPDGTGDVSRTHIQWKLNRGVPSRSSPVLVGDWLFFVNETGVGTCVQAKSGKVMWQERLGGPFSASPVAVGGRVYCFNESGEAHVLELGPTCKRIASNRLEAGCMATPALAGKSLYVRTKTHLYRIEAKR